MTKNYSRYDEDFQQVLIDLIEMAKELEIPPNFETEQVRKKEEEMAV